MSLFPENPVLGQQITGPSGEVWAFDGVKWTHQYAYSVPPVAPKITRIQAGEGLEGGGDRGNIVLSLSLPIPVEYGGTGALDAQAALANLGGPFLSKKGVLSAIEAIPGDIGEFYEKTLSANLSTQTGTSLSLGEAVLPPGDWDVWASATFRTGDNSLQMAAVSLSSLGSASPYNISGSGFIAAPQSQIIFNVPADRLLSANPRTTVQATWRFASPFIPSGNPQVLVTVRARRMR